MAFGIVPTALDTAMYPFTVKPTAVLLSTAVWLAPESITKSTATADGEAGVVQSAWT
jgi:hypothetical protein